MDDRKPCAVEHLDLLKSARAQKDHAYSLELLEQILADSPGAMEPLLLQTHLLSLRGALSLADYRATMRSIVDRVKADGVPDIPTSKKLLRGIQYACTGKERVGLIRDLLDCVRATVPGKPKGWKRLLQLQACLNLALDDLMHFVATVEQLSDLKTAPQGTTALKKVADKITHPDFPDHSREKVFGIGLSRTGTSSLNRALQILGYEAIHWINPHTQTILGRRDFALFDAFSDIPVSYQFEHLYDHYPNARFIYTTRDRASWKESVTAHYMNLRGISSPAELDNPEIAQRFDGAGEPADQNLYIPHETWGEAYDDFDDRVRRFFADRDDTRILELRITDGEGWERLCPFLDRDIPGEPYPDVNKRPGSARVAPQ